MAGDTLQERLMPEAATTALLKLAASGDVGFALAAAKDRSGPVLMLAKKIRGAQLSKQLVTKYKNEIDVNTLRFGTLAVAATDTKTLRFNMNKSAPSGAIAAMLTLARRANYSGVVLEVGAEEAAEADFATASTELAPDQMPGAPPAPPPPPPTATPVDGKARLVPLVRRVAALTDPVVKEPLAALARSVQAKLAAGEPIEAELAALERGLATAGSANGMAQASNATDGPKVALAKSSTLWRGCRSQMRGKLEQLKNAIGEAYAGEPTVLAAIRAEFKTLDRVFETLDDRLDTALNNAISAATPTARKDFVDESRILIAEYQQKVASDVLIAQLDDNPFGIDMKFRETLDKVLPALESLARTLH